MLRQIRVLCAYRRRFPVENWRKTPPGFQFLFFGRCFQSDGAVSRREMSAKHRLDFSFYFSGGVFRVMAPSPGEK
jgi:hypothetical protein